MPYKDPEARRLHDRSYYARNRDKINAYNRAYRQENPELVRAWETNRSNPENRRVAHRVYYRTYRLKHAELLAARRKRDSIKHRTYLRAWRQRRRELLSAQRRAYRQAHLASSRLKDREKARRTRANWTPMQRAAHARYRQRWMQTHRDLYRAIMRAAASRRRARLSQAAMNDLTKEQIALVVASKKGQCDYCSVYNPACRVCKRHAHVLTVDHITAVARRGDNTLWNVTACCQSCNSKKQTNPPPVPVQPLLL